MRIEGVSHSCIRHKHPSIGDNTLTGVVADPDDHKVLECAVVGGATHLVTGDRRHLLPLGSYQGIAIVSAADLLTLVATL
jgi:predicted nucleic acid-binding protein